MTPKEFMDWGLAIGVLLALYSMAAIAAILCYKAVKE
jgi:hypothetical protein